MPLALITGASSGIGREFARQLSSRGYDLLLVARRRDRLEAVGAETAVANGKPAGILVADLATEAGIREVEARIGARPPDLLVNNAGFGSRGTFAGTGVAVQEEMHRLHVLATLRLTHAALAGMLVRGTGAIVNVSSVAGFLSAPGSVSYCATKHWMNVFTEGLWMELREARSAVRVQALCPGFTITEFHDRIDYDRSSVPAALWLRAGFVVAESLRGLEKGTLFVIPDWRYKAIVLAVRLLPRSLARRLSVRRQRSFRRI
jgi:short-subunit dehydrogenase